MEIWIKVIFAILLVIFVSFLIVSLFGTKATTLQQEQHFDVYSQTYRLVMSIFTNPLCIGIASFTANASSSAVVGILDVGKLDMLDRINQDYWCVENYQMMYSIEVVDIEKGKDWLIGLQNTDPGWAERKLSNSFPVGLRYSLVDVSTGVMYLYVYTGEFPFFYGKIKQACLSGDEVRYSIDFRYDISYDQDLNWMCVGIPSAGNCFAPYFSCPVKSFSLSKGQHLLLMKHAGDGLEII
ncbi:hypothetical protein JW968_05185 [Candidatus Woesearchaeota archaeon]|nr:hypothetical protein [Candidatus Woesearchaeota archaeon]